MAVRNLLAHIRKEKTHSSPHDRENLGRAINAYERYRASVGKTDQKRYRYLKKNGVPELKEKAELDRFIEAARVAKEAAR